MSAFLAALQFMVKGFQILLYILSQYEVGAKQMVHKMEFTKDRVAVMTFPCAIPKKVYTLNLSGWVARQGLLENNV